MALEQVWATPEVRGLVLSCIDPYEVPVARRVCRLWRDSQQLSRQQSEDIVREVSFLLERCVLRPFIFERAQEEATDWRCVVCGSVAQDPVDLLLTSSDFDWEAECEVCHEQLPLVPVGLSRSEGFDFVNWLLGEGAWSFRSDDEAYEGLWRQHPFPAA